MLRGRTVSLAWWASGLAMAAAAPAVVVELGVKSTAIAAGSAAVAALATALAAGIQQRYARSLDSRESQRLAFRDGWV